MDKNNEKLTFFRNHSSYFDDNNKGEIFRISFDGKTTERIAFV